MAIFDLGALLLLFSFLGALGWGVWTLTSTSRRMLADRRQRKQLAKQAKADRKARLENWAKLIAESGGYGPEAPVDGYRVYLPLKTPLPQSAEVRFSVDLYEWQHDGWLPLGVAPDEHSESYPATMPIAQLSERWWAFCVDVAERLNRPLYESYAQGKVSETQQADAKRLAADAVSALPSAREVTEGLSSSEIPRV